MKLVPLWIALGLTVLGSVIGMALISTEPAEVAKEIKDWRSAFYTRPCPPVQVKTHLSPGDTIRAWDGAELLDKAFGRKLHTKEPQANKPVVEITDGSGKSWCNDPTQMEHVRNNGDIGTQPTRFNLVLCISNIKAAKSYVGEDESIRSMGRLGVVGAVAHGLSHMWMGKPDAFRSHPVWESGLFAKDARSMEVGPVLRGALEPHLMGCRR